VSTKEPTQQKNPARKALKGKVPTAFAYTNCEAGTAARRWTAECGERREHQIERHRIHPIHLRSGWLLSLAAAR
jgi:hypothetical protein